ncbi:hypothetical protein [Psychroserpens algicola]|uniref:Uncharacterized protein n=1 Tax=Psychroserpens algicola TaxID=1719034 RepID=A0ABT0HD51_9FLAO|nr:hypothetical protein [Psychroserpens algicola]MCK8482284.1 hypothetical protein [Psychroserpens algicola]
MNNDNLTDSIEKEIFNTTSELTQDYAELALDTLTSESLLSEIPIVKSLVSFYNITSSIVDRHNVKKILTFLDQFHSNKIDENKLVSFKQKFSENTKHRNQVLETILILNEKFIDIKKSKILANLFSAHIDGNLTWEEFLKISFILRNLNPAGYRFLEKSVLEKDIAQVNDRTKIMMGMTEYIEGEALLLACGAGSKFEQRFLPTKTGIKLYEYGLKPLNEHSA